ncbi:hypothetical protein HY251_16960, partial [bacterium]|nr:hypothetical protein [bacterium]
MREDSCPEDSPIPSGPWHGFYTDPRFAGRHFMDLVLEFHEGTITGDGIDDVAPFTIRGGYHSETLASWWTKSYRTHTVSYTGAYDLGSIYGTWEISFLVFHARGGFRIWPGARGEGAKIAEEEEAPIDEENAVEATPAPRLWPDSGGDRF